jgi:hypothetical protein
MELVRMTKKTTEKKEFSWDMETLVKVISVNEYENRVVKLCELNGKQFVNVITMKKIKDEWKPVKNATFPMNVWKQVVEAVGSFELDSAFGSIPNYNDPIKVQFVEKSVMKGKKLTVLQQLEKNENWKDLPQAKKDKALSQSTSFLKEFGMVGVIMSKTDCMVTGGIGRDQAEKNLKGVKGFTRAKFTYITE